MLPNIYICLVYPNFYLYQWACNIQSLLIYHCYKTRWACTLHLPHTTVYYYSSGWLLTINFAIDTYSSNDSGGAGTAAE